MKTKRRSIWIPDALWARIAAAARKDGRSASGFILQAVLAALGR